MKKLVGLLLITLSIFAVSAQAAQKKSQSSACPFTDTFTLAGATIQKLTADGNLNINQLNAVQFNDGCKSNDVGNGGNIYLSVNNKSGTCNLVISDGPFDMNPSVISSNCQGTAQYTGMDHPYGSYNYTLKFAG